MDKKTFEEGLIVGDIVIGTGFGALRGKYGVVMEIFPENDIIMVETNASPNPIEVNYKGAKIVTELVTDTLVKYNKMFQELYPGLPRILDMSRKQKGLKLYLSKSMDLS